MSIVICSTDTDSNMEPTQNTEITQNQNQIEIEYVSYDKKVYMKTLLFFSWILELKKIKRGINSSFYFQFFSNTFKHC